MKTKIGTDVAHVTRDSDTTFKVKRSKGQLVAGESIRGSGGTGPKNIYSGVDDSQVSPSYVHFCVWYYGIAL